MIKDYINTLSPKIDILCSQEHKLRGDNMKRNLRLLWRRDNFWSLESNPSNEAKDRRYCYVFPPKIATFNSR